MRNKLITDITKEIEINFRNSANERLVHDRKVFRRMQKTSYLTATDESCQQLNERDSYTAWRTSLQSGLIFILPLTSDPAEEFEIAPEEEIDIEWAKIAKLSRERWSKENPY